MCAQGYAWEITTKEGGWGMDGVLQSRQHVLNGIANGIDMEEWDPATDSTIPKNYSSKDLAGRPVHLNPHPPYCRRVCLLMRTSPRDSKSPLQRGFTCFVYSTEIWRRFHISAQEPQAGLQGCTGGGLTWSAHCAGKQECKAALQKELGLAVDPSVPLLGFIGRLDHQKGPDIVLDAVPELTARNCQVHPATSLQAHCHAIQS